MEGNSNYWDGIYSLKETEDVSWYEETPTLSLNLIEKHAKSKDDPILDIGGGDSALAESLLKKGYTNITVLDISEEALNKAKTRMGENECKIRWVVSDVLEYEPEMKFSVIHDRAAFHFLTLEDKTSKYASIVTDALKEDGTFIVGTFSTDGPTKCSGLDIQQYSKESLQKVFDRQLRLVDTLYVSHTTPWGAEQKFQFSILNH